LRNKKSFVDVARLYKSPHARFRHDIHCRPTRSKVAQLSSLVLVLVCAVSAIRSSIGIVIPAILAGCHNILLIYRHFSLPITWSPSAAICFSIIAASVAFPLNASFAIPMIWTISPPWRRWRFPLALLAVLAIPACAIAMQFLIWGTFPVNYDAHGVEYVRMIPFYPWPTEQFPGW
jgi:hypothetical protein